MMNSAQSGTRQPTPANSYVVHFTDANGNRQPGVRAVEPPADTRQAIRGNLYAVIELYQASSDLDHSVAGERATTNMAELARISEQLLGVIQTTYYSAKGSQSQVLEAAILAVHQSLQQANQGRGDSGLRAGVTCAALLNNRLLIMTSGPALSFIITDDAVQQFPFKEIGADKAPGGDSAPDQHTYRRDFSGGGVLFLGGRSWLQHLPVRTLLGVITQAEPENAVEIANYLGQESHYDPIPGLLVLAGVDRGDSTVGAGGAVQSQSSSPLSSQSPSEQSGRPGDAARRARPAFSREGGLGTLPTAVNATPPVRQIPPPAESLSTLPENDSALPAAVPRDDRVEAERQPIDSRHSPVGEVDKVDGSAAGNEFTDLKSAIEVATGSATERDELKSHSSQQPNWAERISTMVARVRGLVQTVLPELSGRAQGRGEEASRTMQRSGTLTEAPSEPSSTAATMRSHTAEVLAEPLAQMQAFQPPKPTSGRRARLFITAAVLLAVLVPVIVFTVVWQRGASVRAEANMLIEAAQASALRASAALDLGDKGAARSELTKAQETLREATALVGNRPEITQLAVQIEKELQNVLQIVPLYKLVEPLIRFPLDASPHRVMVVDQDIYILDQGRNLIQRYRLDGSLVALADGEGEVVLRLGDQIDGVTVGPLIDIAWQPPIPGIQDKANLLVLDGNNNVFKYNQRVEGAAYLPLGGRAKWQTPLQIQTYLGRLYVADGANGQIFRYSASNYEAEPDEWMNSPIPQGLSGLQSMFIDGNIWILLSNGTVLKYNQGVQEPFALDSDVGMMTEPVDMFIGEQDAALIYVADAGNSRILVYDKDGNYQHQFQAPEGSALRDLRSIFVDEVTNTIFILTKSSLFQHPLPQ